MTLRSFHQLFAAAVAIAVATAFIVRGEAAAPDPSEPAPSERGAGIGLLHAQRFELERAAQHRWRKGWPLYDAGWLLVLDVDPSLVIPRQGLEPVLYVGNQTARRVNPRPESGHVVAIVPGDFPLREALLFFGTPALPERITAADIERELAAARADRVAPLAEAQIASVLHPAVRLPDVHALDSLAIDLVERHSPAERDWVRGQRVPQVK